LPSVFKYFDAQSKQSKKSKKINERYMVANTSSDYDNSSVG